jgi:hypothetical protein
VFHRITGHRQAVPAEKAWLLRPRAQSYTEPELTFNKSLKIPLATTVAIRRAIAAEARSGLGSRVRSGLCTFVGARRVAKILGDGPQSVWRLLDEHRETLSGSLQRSQAGARAP